MVPLSNFLFSLLLPIIREGLESDIIDSDNNTKLFSDSDLVTVTVMKVSRCL